MHNNQLYHMSYLEQWQIQAVIDAKQYSPEKCVVKISPNSHKCQYLSAGSR